MLLHRYGHHQAPADFRLMAVTAVEHGASTLRVARAGGIALAFRISHATRIEVQLMVELQIRALDHVGRSGLAHTHAPDRVGFVGVHQREPELRVLGAEIRRFFQFRIRRHASHVAMAIRTLLLSARSHLHSLVVPVAFRTTHVAKCLALCSRELGCGHMLSDRLVAGDA